WAAEPLGRSAAMEHVRALCARVAPTASTVLLRGETGTGKEVMARTIHRLSPRRNRPFIVVDCSATEDTLALSELFGHERGGYTGATHRRHGLFELADQGTVLIDEVGDASPALQASLLRVLETDTIRRVGGESPIRVDVRVLAATHRDLEARAREGTFREDLYHRLNVFAIQVPTLQQHAEDIPELVDHFLAAVCPTHTPVVEDEARTLLMRYHWPGNIRELRNVLERAVILSGGGSIRPEHLPPGFATPRPRWEAAPDDPPLSLREVESRYLVSLLERFGGHHGHVAAALGISERTLYRKLRAARHRRGD
ncbi:MAG TPA: sigma-54 dependent transcriptional regulator, partial [Thermoanaerobaculaceae bacterium]|nr:sigma-54 dependent transcriptional regulator [Thermoanaerobaculaceae bacterium]